MNLAVCDKILKYFILSHNVLSDPNQANGSVSLGIIGVSRYTCICHSGFRFKPL